MSSTITPLKIYHEWFAALETDWKNEIAQSVIKDVFLTSSLFLSIEDDMAYKIFNSIDDYPARLIILIDENIINRNIDYERLLCQQLFISTEYSLITIASTSDEVYKELQRNQMESTISNNPERSVFYEEGINKIINNQLTAAILLDEWYKFTKEYFNLNIFYEHYNDIQIN